MIDAILIHRRKQRGFSLMEIAIVLLAIGIVVGAIWVAASKASDNVRVQNAARQLNMSVQNIRQYFLNAQSFSTSGDITTLLDDLNLFPVDMRRNPAPGGPIDHGLSTFAGGSFHVLSENCPAPVLGNLNCFRVQMLGLKAADCIKILETVPVSDTEMGVVQVGAQNMTGGSTTLVIPQPSASTVASWCNLAGDNNEADWDFKLHN